MAQARLGPFPLYAADATVSIVQESLRCGTSPDGRISAMGVRVTLFVTLQPNEVCVARPPSAVREAARPMGMHSRGRLCHTNHSKSRPRSIRLKSCTADRKRLTSVMQCDT